MSTSTLRPISRAAAVMTRNDTKSAATESPWGQPRDAATSPSSTATVPARSLPKWSALESSAALEYCRAARSETTVRETSMAITANTTANTHHAASTSVSITPVSLSTANVATPIATRLSTAASARAARCSAFPCP